MVMGLVFIAINPFLLFYISQKDQVERSVRTLLTEWNQIDILVNNAGVWTYGEVGNMSDDIWRKTMELNLDAVFFLCNAVVPIMKKKKEPQSIKKIMQSQKFMDMLDKKKHVKFEACSFCR